MVLSFVPFTCLSVLFTEQINKLFSRIDGPNYCQERILFSFRLRHARSCSLVYVSSVPNLQEPAREVMKGPIPAKHIILQETFDSLVQRCRNTVNNPVSDLQFSSVKVGEFHP